MIDSIKFHAYLFESRLFIFTTIVILPKPLILGLGIPHICEILLVNFNEMQLYIFFENKFIFNVFLGVKASGIDVKDSNANQFSLLYCHKNAMKLFSRKDVK